MNRQEFWETIHPLTEFEQQKKKNYERSGVLFQPLQESPHCRRDDSGYYIISNEAMSRLPDHTADSLHAPLFFDAVRHRLRLIIHSRFAEIPFHSTEFVSINYVYSGRLLVRFPDRSILLQPGQLIFMNDGIVHSMVIEGEHDSILGIQIEKNYLSDDLLYGLKGIGPVADFLISAMTGQSSEFSYMISGFETDDRMKNLFEDMFCEYFDPGMGSDVLIANYMRIFFSFLIRSTSNVLQTNKGINMLEILSYLETHYKDCSLQELSGVFHFHPKYLGNLIRKNTGATFQQHLENKRMRMVCYYLENTALPVRDIAQNCGYSNLTFFFRRFQELYGMTPAKYRRRE